MDNYIFEANIGHYKKLLAAETQAGKIAILRKLLAEEEAKLENWRARNPRAKAVRAGLVGEVWRR